MTRDIEELLQHVLPYAPACPDITAVHHLRQAARTFCAKTMLWQEDVAVSTGTTSGLVQVTVPFAEVLGLREARYADGSGNLERKSLDDLDRECPGWLTMTGQPRYVTQRSRGSFTVVPIGAASLVFSLYLRPDLLATELPDFLLENHAEALAAGALADILLIPDKSFSNLQVASVFAGRFQKAMDELVMAAVSGQQHAPARARARYF